MNLLIGDGSESNYHLAINLFGNCSGVLNNSNFANVDLTKTYHTSLGDLTVENLLEAIKKSTQVRVGILKDFLNNDNKRLINSILINQNLVNHQNLIGNDIYIKKDEIVFIGCSHTEGTGVSKNERFSNIVSQELELTEKNLGRRGSGIWEMHDLFHCCQFNQNQKVVLQVNDPYRFNYFGKNNNVERTSFRDVNDKKTILTYNDNILSYQYYSLLNGIFKTALKLKLNLVCFKISESLSLSYNKIDFLLQSFPGSIIVNEFKDLGTDKLHPGPLTHKEISSTIVKKFRGIK